MAKNSIRHILAVASALPSPRPITLPLPGLINRLTLVSQILDQRLSARKETTQ